RTGNWAIEEPRPDDVCELEEGVYYVNLCRAEYVDDLEPRLDELAGARGIIVDVRGYPTRFAERLLGHMTDATVDCAQWLVPQFIYPDREQLVGYDPGGRWSVEPAKPRFGAEVVFLTDARAISYAESVMGMVEHYELGSIVGSPTAGTNGNINFCPLPGDGTLVFTGMRVLKHDGSQHHLVGIRPTDPVARTLEGIRAGRDEVLEHALGMLVGRD
ncbi:MAG: S41 family peptidase, partial [Halobacteriales archaeon]|nr:S41 family peptidase [Halobacteriales archaeon]